MGTIQGSINSALGSVGQVTAIGKAVKTYGKEQDIKQAENLSKVADEKANILSEKAGLQEENINLNRAVKEAREGVAKAEAETLGNASPEARRIRAEANKRLEDAKFSRTYNRKIIKEKLALAGEKLKLVEQKEAAYKGGKK